MVNMVTKSFTDATPTIITYNTYTFQAYFYNRPDLENGSLNLNININLRLRYKL